MLKRIVTALRYTVHRNFRTVEWNSIFDVHDSVGPVDALIANHFGQIGI